MKPIDNTTGVERVANTLLGTAAAAVTAALTRKLLGQPKRAKRTKRKPASAKKTKAAAATAGQEVRHG